MAQLDESQRIGEVPAGVDPSQQEQARDIGNAHQERLEANLGGDFAVPVWAAFGHAETGDMQSSCSTDMGGTRPSSVMRHQGYALAETVFGVCSEDNVPLELAQQDRFPSGDESSASLQVAFARPNLQLMESMESNAIETNMKTDGVYKLPKSNYDLCYLVLEVQRSVDELPVKRHIIVLLGPVVETRDPGCF